MFAAFECPFEMMESSWYLVKTNGQNRRAIRFSESGLWVANPASRQAPYVSIQINDTVKTWVESVRLTDVTGITSVNIRAMDTTGRRIMPIVSNSFLYYSSISCSFSPQIVRSSSCEYSKTSLR